jgi:hypothetical protein
MGSFIPVGQYLLDYRRIFDTGNYLDSAAAFTARFDVNIEHSLESLRPGHGRMTRSVIGRPGSI